MFLYKKLKIKGNKYFAVQRDFSLNFEIFEKWNSIRLSKRTNNHNFNNLNADEYNIL